MNKFKRLYFDIEVSFNTVSSWGIGRKITLSHENIINERAIICICYKWEGESKVHSLQWNKGDDKKMLQDFIKVMNEADEVVGHNGDSFDIKWLRTRCLYHNIPMFPNYSSIDTLKLSKKYFRFNSNKLDYIAQFLSIGKKKYTSYDLWKNIVFKNDSLSMKKMIDYCKGDVKLLEQVYKKLENYVGHNSHIGIHNGNTKLSCPSCGNKNLKVVKTRISATGVKSKQMQCNDCGKYHSMSETTYNKLKK